MYVGLLVCDWFHLPVTKSAYLALWKSGMTSALRQAKATFQLNNFRSLLNRTRASVLFPYKPKLLTEIQSPKDSRMNTFTVILILIDSLTFWYYLHRQDFWLILVDFLESFFLRCCQLLSDEWKSRCDIKIQKNSSLHFFWKLDDSKKRCKVLNNNLICRNNFQVPYWQNRFTTVDRLCKVF